MHARLRRCGGPALVVLVTLAVATTTHAQSAQERQAAAEAYDRGTSAWLAEEYARAARFFETAHQLAPNAAALVQAVRSHQRAGNHLRSANLALRLKALYPQDDRGAKVATPILDEARDTYVRVNVLCQDCSIDLDGTLEEYPSFFVDPGVEHVVLVGFDSGEVSRAVVGEPGEVVNLEVVAPEPSELAPDEALEGPKSGPSKEAPKSPPSKKKLPPWVTLSALGATAVVGDVTLWSGLDTLSGVDEFEATGSRTLYERGEEKERRTNFLIGTTVAMGAVTGVLAIFTDWKGASRSDRVDASVAPLPEGGVATVRGRF